ncbi:MAG TPA: hypothetical protein VFD58_28925 [Blastocatellia bacterium]|nr:hypothetical protein [Blastocatellia bacterium]
MRRVLLICLLISALVTTVARSQGTSQDSRILTFARKIRVRQLDHRLPEQGFGEWFRRVAGSGAKIKWEVNDCGEQTGTDADRQRDLPLCSQAEAALPDGRRAVVLIAVGSFRRGIVRKPALWSCFVERNGQFQTVGRLGDLSAALREK